MPGDRVLAPEPPADGAKPKGPASYFPSIEKTYGRPIVTEVTALKAFYPAEAYHQDFAARNPTYPYIVVHDLPKVANLQKQFPEIYVRR